MAVQSLLIAMRALRIKLFNVIQVFISLVILLIFYSWFRSKPIVRINLIVEEEDLLQGIGADTTADERRIVEVTSEAEITELVPTAPEEEPTIGYTEFPEETTRSTYEEQPNYAQIFQDRFNLVQRSCPITSKNDVRRKAWVPNDNFLVDLPKRILVCAVPKAGSTNWHMLMWKLRRQRAGLPTDVEEYTYNDTLKNIEIARNTDSVQGQLLVKYQPGIDDNVTSTEWRSHRLILIRHPISRLISGWNQKFHKNSQYWRDLYVRYPKMKQYKNEDGGSHELSFKDFASFIADYGGDVDALDYHFKPASALCNPCGYVYTYVVKTETFDREGPWLRERLNITDLEIGRNGVGPQMDKILSNIDNQRLIDLHMGTLETTVIKKLTEVYKHDFTLFGYTFDPYTLEAGGLT